MGKGRSKRRAQPVSPPVAPKVEPRPRLYDLPFSSPAPTLVNPEIRLHKMMARRGHNAAYEIDVTLLDAPDHRLMRSGVLLAHRVLDGRGEWYLTAPDWAPLLPQDRVEPMGDAELPEEFAHLIRPLRRRATLGPVAALHCDRREFSLRDASGQTVALLRDDLVTVRRGGLTTARYREVTITPMGAGLDDAQMAWLDRAFALAGATPVSQFPRLVTRLGAPATGPTDIPAVGEFDPHAPFKRFVSQLLAGRLRGIVEADLAIRNGQLAATHQLAEQADHLRLELRGLSTVLDSDWIEDLYDELDWIVTDTDLAARLRSERYLTLLERLVTAVRSPQFRSGAGLGGGARAADATRSDTPAGLISPAHQPAAVVGSALLAAAAARLRQVADGLTARSDDAAFAEAHRALGQLSWVADLTRLLQPEETARLDRRLTKPRRRLAEIVTQRPVSDARLAAAELTPDQAFDAGRRWERETSAARRVREDFVRSWAKTSPKLSA